MSKQFFMYLWWWGTFWALVFVSHLLGMEEMKSYVLSFVSVALFLLTDIAYKVEEDK